MDPNRTSLHEWYEKVAQRYDTWGEREREYPVAEPSEEVASFNKMLDSIKFEKEATTLDIATGTGTFLLESVKRGLKGCGIDFSTAMIDQAKKKIQAMGFKNRIIELKVGDACKTGYPDRMFDLVTCIGMFDYYDLDEVSKFLAEMARITKDDGYIIVDFPNKDNPETPIFRERERSVGHEVYIHDISGIDSFLSKEGFNILSHRDAGMEIQFMLKKRCAQNP